MAHSDARTGHTPSPDRHTPSPRYGVSPAHASAFEAAYNDGAFADDVSNDPELQLKKAAMVPPSVLLSAGVPVCRAVQRPGQFVFTLPRAYHAGFSNGFTVAEAVNFALPEWLSYVAGSNRFYQLIGREPVLDLEQILVLAAREGERGHSAAVTDTLREMIESHLAGRKSVRASGAGERAMCDADREHLLGRGPPCDRCGHVCHLGFVQLGTERPRGRDAPPISDETRGKVKDPKVSCVVHVDEVFDGSSPKQRVLFTRYTDAELRELAARRADDDASGTPLVPHPDGPPKLCAALRRAIEAKRGGSGAGSPT